MYSWGFRAAFIHGIHERPSRRRSAAKLGATRAASPNWDIRSPDITQAFLKCENPKAHGRILVIPPMAAYFLRGWTFATNWN